MGALAAGAAFAICLILVIYYILSKVTILPTIDVYDVDAFYIRAIETKTLSDQVKITVVLADSRPSAGSSRCDDRAYDTRVRVSYVGKIWFPVDTAVKVEKMLRDRHSSAHADL